MNGDALGLIETVGLVAAVTAADTCLKSANVSLVGYELTRGSGLVTVKISGDVSAVTAAVSSAKVSATLTGKVYSTLIIPRPSKSTDNLISTKETVGIDHKAEVEKVQEVCNLCGDPKCPRKKGMPRKLCIHYKQ